MRREFLLIPLTTMCQLSKMRSGEIKEIIQLSWLSNLPISTSPYFLRADKLVLSFLSITSAIVYSVIAFGWQRGPYN